MSDNRYTIADLTAMRDLRWRHCTTGTENFEDFLARQSKSNLQYLLDQGHERDVAMRVAITADTLQWPGRRYQEAFVSDDERQPIPTERDWLISRGYDADTVDEYLANARARQAEREAARAKQEAYERTWRFRVGRTWREAKWRTKTAVDVLRGDHECEDYA